MMRVLSKQTPGPAGTRRGRPGVLLVLAGFLAASGAIRLGDGIGLAFAESAGDPAASESGAGTAVSAAHTNTGTADAQTAAEVAGAELPATAAEGQGGAGGTDSCAPGPGTAELIAAIKERNEVLDRREARIADRESAALVAQAAIEARIAALTAAEEELAKTIAMADTAAEEDVARLVAVYENMKPKDAIPVFAEMDPDFAAGFLGRMRAEAAAAVMAGLDPKVAYTISAILAGRNANAPVN